MALRGGALGLAVLLSALLLQCDSSEPVAVKGSAIVPVTPPTSELPVKDCSNEPECTLEGRCTWRDGGCVVAKDADCQMHAHCMEPDLCTAVAGKCVASAAACKASEGCRKFGTCSSVGGVCRAAGNDDCRQSWDCKRGGFCTAKSGTCRVDSAEDCERSSRCAEMNMCVTEVVEGTGHKLCTDVNAPPCAESAPCRVHGHCGGKKTCKARNTADCEQSENCKNHGQCVFVTFPNERRGECVETCADFSGCQLLGLCTKKGNECQAGDDADCQKSGVCEMGHCSAKDGECVAAKEEDCRGKVCSDYGRCTVGNEDNKRHKGHCVAANAKQCLASTSCAQRGECTPDVDGHCVVKSTADCEALCKRDGLCTVSGKFVRECVAATNADCQGSQACKKEGRCTARSSECVTGN